MKCVLCLKDKISHYHRDRVRDYWQCHNCKLVFVLPNDYLDKEHEKRVYDQHKNNPNDLGYRKFLNKLVIPLTQKLEKGAKGLDFGSGPGPTVAIICAELGFDVVNYDIFYANESKLLQKEYDFITCTEVIEHVHKPHQVINQFKTMLKPQAYLGIMTKRVIDKQSFKNWHYKNDPTHVCYYSDETFEFIAENWKYNLKVLTSDTVLLKSIEV